MALRRIGTAERIAITASGLLPFAGAVFLGWSIATALAVALWDAVICTLRILPAGMIDAYEDRHQMQSLTDGMVVAVLGGLLTWGLLVVFIVHFARTDLNDLVATFQPGGLETEAWRLAQEEPWWLAFIALVRIWQIALDLLRDKARGMSKAMEGAMGQVMLLFLRGFAVLSVAWLAASFTSLGHWVLVAFFGAACALQVWFELHGQKLVHRPTWREEEAERNSRER